MSRREQLLQALLAALKTVPGVELVERNRTYKFDESTESALVLMDGHIEGQTDRQEWRREPVFRMELTPEVIGYVISTDAEVGTVRDRMLSDTIEAVWTNAALRDLLEDFDGDLSIDGMDCMLPAKAASQTAGVFAVGFRISLLFDPARP